MENTSNQKNDENKPSKGKTLGQILKEMPYSNDRIGQAFIRPFTIPKNYISSTSNDSENSSGNDSNEIES